eukprot:3476864-Karenia_brevis.AAC.1
MQPPFERIVLGSPPVTRQSGSAEFEAVRIQTHSCAAKWLSKQCHTRRAWEAEIPGRHFQEFRVRKPTIRRRPRRDPCRAVSVSVDPSSPADICSRQCPDDHI